MDNDANGKLSAEKAIGAPPLSASNSRIKKIWGAFLLIFISGALVGGIIGFYAGKPPKKGPGSQSFRQRVFDNYVRELALTPEQQRKIRPVMDKGFDRIQDFKLKRSGELIEIISRNYDELKVFLTPEQLRKLEDMRHKTMARAQGRMQEKL